MLTRTAPRAATGTARVFPRARHFLGSARAASGSADSPPPQSRIDRVSARLPKFLRPKLAPVLHAPVSHVTAFLVLHELTAIAPLVTLAAYFHYSNWLPPYVTEGAWVKQGVEKFGAYFRRKGWLGAEGGRRDGTWRLGEGGVRIVVEVATAWAITKALLPLRLALSVWGTPWAARTFMVPVGGWLGKLLGRGGGGGGGAAAAGKKGKGAQAPAPQQVRNEGPLYKERPPPAAPAPAATPAGGSQPPAASASGARGSSSAAPPAAGSGATSAKQAGSGAPQPAKKLPPGVKVDGPLYKSREGGANASV